MTAIFNCMRTMKTRVVIITTLILACCTIAFGRQKEPPRNLFDWQGLPAVDAPVRGAFVGVSNDAVIIAGGTYHIVEKPKAEKQVYVDTISILEADSNTWQRSFKLEHPLAYGASVSTDNATILIGGTNGRRCYAQVLCLRWDNTAKKLNFEYLPDLPQPCAYTSAAIIDRTVYVAGGIDSPGSRTALKNFWAMDLSRPQAELKWQELTPWPDGPGRISPVTAAQNSGEYYCFYIFGGDELITGPDGGVARRHLTDAYRYNPFEKDISLRWKKNLDVPEPVTAYPTIDIGQSHILVFASNPAKWLIKAGVKTDTLAYHTITNTWVKRKELPDELFTAGAFKWSDKTVIFGNGGPSGTGPTRLFSAELAELKTRFGVVNYLTLGGYLIVLVLVGLYFSKSQKCTDDYFLAGRRVPWWAAGMSIYATSFSAISFMSTPAKIYATDWLYFFGIVALMPVVLFTIYFFLPFVRRLNVTTAYEYLEKRFNLWVRLFGSAVFILFQLGRMAIVLLLPALALATVTGINVQVCILTMGILCIIYTVLGGIEAVIWNDCLQLIVLTGGALMILFTVGANLEGGFASVISTGLADSKFRIVNCTWDYTVTALWVVFFGNFLSNLAPYITDQAVIQRYLTTADIKQAGRSLWFNFWALIPISLLFFTIGTALYAFYKSRPELLSPVIKTDAILPWFVVQKMPIGVCGLVVAGIFAASMSSLDSSIHAVSTAIVTDFYRRFNSGASETFYLKLARRLTAIIGVTGTAAASIMAVYNIASLWDLFMTILGLVSGGLAGIFLLGILTRRANGPGVFVGAVISAVLVFAVQTYTRMHFFLFGAVGVVSAMTVGYIASLVIPARPQNLDGLTIYTINNRKD